MIQATNTFLKISHVPAPFHRIAFYRHAEQLLDELYILHTEQGEETF